MNTNSARSGRRLFVSTLELLVIAGIILLGFGAFTHKQQLLDWWRLKSYNPPAKISALADSTTMTAVARRDFYASEPQIENHDDFNQNCSVIEQTIVLGCYVGGSQRIYIYKVDDPRLNGVEQVTAAHETLHAVYARLSDKQRSSVDALLENQMKKLNSDDHLKQLISLYNTQEPGQLLNEMHSILGTEYSHLSPQLEAYYSKYFTNRQVLVNYADNYKAVFNQMQKQIAQDESLLRDIKQSIDSLGGIIEGQKAQLAAQQSQLSNMRSNNPEAYNNQVPIYNQLVNSYNDNISKYRNLINQYNSIVKDHNSIAIEFNDLNNELNSSYQTIK